MRIFGRRGESSRRARIEEVGVWLAASHWREEGRGSWKLYVKGLDHGLRALVLFPSFTIRSSGGLWSPFSPLSSSSACARRSPVENSTVGDGDDQSSAVVGCCGKDLEEMEDRFWQAVAIFTCK